MSISDISSSSIALSPDSNGMHLTPSEFDRIADWDDMYRYELINGVVIVTPFAGPGERKPNSFLDHLLWQYSNHPHCTMAETLYEQEIRCGDNRRRADRVIWLGGPGRKVDPRNDVPEIVIEFVAKSRRDRHRDYIQKRKEYTAAGVKEYWIIDRFQRELVVFRGDAVEVISEDNVYCTVLMPGFELSLRELFQWSDRYEG